jgi:hypothetical protein
MKKIIITFFTVLLCSVLFARETKTYITAAYNFGKFTERADKAQTEIENNGIDLSVAGYFGNNWGIYLNTDYLFPSKMTVSSGGISLTTTSSDWNHAMFISVIIGPTYKYTVNENFELFGALGFHLAQFSLTSENVAGLNYSFGIGGDFGVRYLPTKNFYLTGGCLLTHDFYCKGETTIRGYGTTETSDSYNLGSFRPYIGIGFSFTEIIK